MVLVWTFTLDIAVSAEALRILESGDENQDGRYTGEDLELGLQRCRPGCLLRIGPHLYEDVSIVIENEFPEGLTIEGAGSGRSILRSPVPVGGPVFWLKGGQSGVVFSHFGLDGRKDEQTNLSQISESVGIRVSDLSRRGSDAGRIESVAIAHFLTAGILVRDGRNWQIRDNRVDDIGCHTSQPCPLMPGADADPHVKGRRTVGYGIMLNGVSASGALVESNRVSNVSKIGIEAFSSGATPGSKDRIRDARLIKNRVSGAVSVGITSNGGVGIEIIGNEVWDSGGPGLIGNGGAGISCGGPSEKILIADNVVYDTDGSGLRIGCKGNDVTVRGNRVEAACRRNLVEQGAIQIVGRKGRGRGIVIENNVVDGAVDRCTYALLLVQWDDVQLLGGRYEGGSRSAIYVGDSKGVRVADLEASALNGPSVWIRPDVTDITIAADVRIDRAAIRDTGATDLVFEAN
jgi:hypothetical protein